MITHSLLFSFLFLLVAFNASATFEFAVSPELNALCTGITNSDDCAQKIEQYQMRVKGSAAQRRGRELLIRLNRGKHVTLKDKDLHDEEKVYRYIEYLQAIKHHLALVHYTEDIEFLLISHETGKQRKIPNVPHIAPDGKHLIATLDDDMTGVTGIHIYGVSSNGIRPEFSDNTVREKAKKGQPDSFYAYESVVWEDPSCVRLRELTTADPALCPGKHFMRLTVRYQFNAGKWILSEDRGSVVCDKY